MINEGIQTNEREKKKKKSFCVKQHGHIKFTVLINKLRKIYCLYKKKIKNLNLKSCI